ncbi:ribonuclease G [Selenomonas sp. TAMA-11512]|uniref:Rne/Rng family ribonuclease n=1 Tax=Selenomonas sp. TAMA-11512 TaxID=3095337 RepID=UPI003090357A|nr:ribonuclease G [Selenomonas sp. TAMA-11512]
MKKILVSADRDEIRMALLADERLHSFEVERPSREHLVGNIYKGRVQNVLPGMQAAFLDIGGDKNAFLYIGDGLPHGAAGGVSEKAKIHVGQNLPVQIMKDAIGTKGPRATLHISLPGRHLVLLPTAAYIAISRRITDEEERERLKSIGEELVPQGMGVILRTAAKGKSKEDLAADIGDLHRLWQSLLAKMSRVKAPALLYRDVDLLVRLMRDSFTEDVDELIIDDRTLYAQAKDLAETLSPALADRIQYYDGKTPLFALCGVEEEIERLGDREVPLASGGSIIMDHTEALTAIDVNTKGFVGDTNLSDTAYRTNLEAAKEILKQLRLRDIGGIILVDFIDMEKESQKEALLSFLREEVKEERTRTNIVDITALGLVEITRKKSRQNLESILYTSCPSCLGRGRVESPETMAIRICRDLRRIEARAHAANGYIVEVSPFVIDTLTSSEPLRELRKELSIDVELEAVGTMNIESYSILQKS